jgi:phage shock protein E
MTPHAKVALAVLALSASSCLFAFSGDLSGREARRMVAEGALLLDVRTPGEYAAGHLEGAVNVPVQVLATRLDELGAHERPIVVYCRSGHRSANAAALLRDAGFTDVHDLGAMSRWPD